MDRESMLGALDDAESVAREILATVADARLSLERNDRTGDDAVASALVSLEGSFSDGRRYVRQAGGAA